MTAERISTFAGPGFTPASFELEDAFSGSGQRRKFAGNSRLPVAERDGVKSDKSIGIFIDGTFVPERDGASARFARLPVHLAAHGMQVVAFHCYRGWSDLTQIARAPFRTYLFSPQTYYDDLDTIRMVVREAGIGAIQMNDAETICRIGYPLAESMDIPLIFEAHYHTSTVASALGAPPERVEFLHRLNQDVSRHVDHIIVFTEADRERWINLSRCPADRITVIPFGVEAIAATPSVSRSGIVFLGNVFYEPNRRALLRLAAEWLPLVRAIRPDTDARVIGDLPKDLHGICAEAGIEVVGEVADPADCLARSAVGVAPLSEGSGVRVKILHYLAAGVPVVATSVAAEGLDFPSIFVEEDPVSAARRCVHILDDPGYYAPSAERTRALLEEKFLWRDIARHASALYAEISAQKRMPRSGHRFHCVDLPMWIQEVLAKDRFSGANAAPLVDRNIAVAERGEIKFAHGQQKAPIVFYP
jgi:glycosyltransferase involved in cell wall biosynthesis